MHKPNPQMENPIKDARIVSDMTFAVRLRSFINKVDVCDLPGEEEKEYLLNVANNLIDWQRLTVMDKSEKDYLKRLNLI